MQFVEDRIVHIYLFYFEILKKTYVNNFFQLTSTTTEINHL